MLSEIYHLALAIPKIRNQRLGKLGVFIYLNYLRVRIKSHIFRWLGQNRTQETFLGYQIHFFSYSTFVYLIEEIFVYGTYRFSTNKASPRILDCGSNIGISLLYFKTLFPDSRIDAFEPDSATFSLLLKNIESNRLSHVVAHNIALSDKNGEITFHSSQTGSLSASVLTQRDSKKVKSVTVPCRAINDFLTEPIDFLKMDIEGAEWQCIPELVASQKIKQVQQMAIECHHNIGKKDPILTTVLSALEKSGFIYQISSYLNPLNPRTESQDIMIFAESGGIS
jgi:FkbM family methyltransferase